MKRTIIVLAAAAATALGLAAPAAADTLAQQVASLDVAAEQRAGYDRDLFGDYDRDAVLQRNLDAFPGCDGYFSRYDNVCYALADFGGDPERADDEVDIDHRVALAEAWDSGAHAWSSSQRDLFAADMANLNVMTDNLNASKGDDDVAEWTPSHGPSVCHYTRAYVSTKVEYDLSVDSTEKAALNQLVDRCEGGQSGNGGGNGNQGDGGQNGGGRPSGDDETGGTQQTTVVPRGGVDTGDGSLAGGTPWTPAALLLLAVGTLTLGGIRLARR